MLNSYIVFEFATISILRYMYLDKCKFSARMILKYLKKISYRIIDN